MRKQGNLKRLIVPRQIFRLYPGEDADTQRQRIIKELANLTFKKNLSGMDIPMLIELANNAAVAAEWLMENKAEGWCYDMEIAQDVHEVKTMYLTLKNALAPIMHMMDELYKIWLRNVPPDAMADFARARPDTPREW